MTQRRSSVLDVNEWMKKADDLVSEITSIVSDNDPTRQSNSFPQYVEEIKRGVIELGFRDVIHFCESFPAKFIIDTPSGVITLSTCEKRVALETATKRVVQLPKKSKKKESTKPKTERKKHSSHKKPTPIIDEDTMALLANYNPVPPSLRSPVKKAEMQMVKSAKKSECVHFKIAHGGKTRRFAIPKDFSFIIGAVKERVGDIIGKKDLLLYWRDEESLIILECGEDMQAAIDFAESQRRPPTCVVIEAAVAKEEQKEEQVGETVEAKKEGNAVEKKEEVVEEKQQEEVVAPKMVSCDESRVAFNGFAFMCDACDVYLAPSNGGRFKCMICDNYDLCAACVGKGVHDNHALVRLLNSATIIPLEDKEGTTCHDQLRKTRRCTPTFVAKNVELPPKAVESICKQFNDDLKKERVKLEQAKQEQSWPVKSVEEEKKQVDEMFENIWKNINEKVESSMKEEGEKAKQSRQERMQKLADNDFDYFNIVWNKINQDSSLEKKNPEEISYHQYLSPFERVQMENEDRQAWELLRMHNEEKRIAEERKQELERITKESEKKKLEVILDEQTKTIKKIDEERKQAREEKRDKENREIRKMEEEEGVNPMLASLFMLLQEEESKEEQDALEDLDDLFDSDSDPPFSLESDNEELFRTELAEESEATKAAVIGTVAACAVVAAPPSAPETAAEELVGNAEDASSTEAVWPSDQWRWNADPRLETEKFVRDRDEFVARAEDIHRIPLHLEGILLSEMHDGAGSDQFPAMLKQWHALVSKHTGVRRGCKQQKIFTENEEVENEIIRLIAVELADRLKMMIDSVAFALPSIRRKMIWGRICEIDVLIGMEENSYYRYAAMQLRPILCDDPFDGVTELCEAAALELAVDQSLMDEAINYVEEHSGQSTTLRTARADSSDGSDIEIIDMHVEESNSVHETMQVLESKFASLELKLSTESAAAAAAASTEEEAAAPEEVDPYAPIAISPERAALIASMVLPSSIWPTRAGPAAEEAAAPATSVYAAAAEAEEVDPYAPIRISKERAALTASFVLPRSIWPTTFTEDLVAAAAQIEASTEAAAAAPAAGLSATATTEAAAAAESAEAEEVDPYAPITISPERAARTASMVLPRGIFARARPAAAAPEDPTAAPAAAAPAAEPSESPVMLNDDIILPEQDLIDFDGESDRLCSSRQKAEEAFPSEEWKGPDLEEVEAELTSFIADSRSEEVQNIPAFMEYNILSELHEMECIQEIPIRLEMYCNHVTKNTKDLKDHKTILSHDKEVDKELVKRVATGLAKRLQNMRNIVNYAMPSHRKDMILNRVCELRTQIREFKYDERWFETVCHDLHSILLTDEYTVSYNPIKSIEKGWQFVYEQANGFVQQAKATAPKFGDFLHSHPQPRSRLPPYEKPKKEEKEEVQTASPYDTPDRAPPTKVMTLSCRKANWDPWEENFPVEPSVPTLPTDFASTGEVPSTLGEEFNQHGDGLRANQELNDAQRVVLSELIETGIFDDYDKMVMACGIATSLEQAIELMLVEA